jgi:hypothetical protein
MQYGHLLSDPRAVCCVPGMVLWVADFISCVFFLEEYCECPNPVFCDSVSVHRLAYYYSSDQMAQTRIKETYYCLRLDSDFSHLDLMWHLALVIPKISS